MLLAGLRHSEIAKALERSTPAIVSKATELQLKPTSNQKNLATKSKASTGSDDRLSNPTLTQPGEGLPDEGGASDFLGDEEVERVLSKLVGGNAHAMVKKEVEQDSDFGREVRPDEPL